MAYDAKTKKWLQAITLVVLFSFIAGSIIVGGLSFRSIKAPKTPAAPREPQAQDALQSWREAAKQNPRDPFILRNLSRALLENGKIAEAKETLAKAKALSPNDPLNEELAGLIALAEKNPGEAVVAFKKALSLKPKDPIFEFELAQAMKLEKAKPR